MADADRSVRDETVLSRRGFLGRSTLAAGVLGAVSSRPLAAGPGPARGGTGPARHPLDPLSAEEIGEAARVVRAAGPSAPRAGSSRSPWPSPPSRSSTASGSATPSREGPTSWCSTTPPAGAPGLVRPALRRRPVLRAPPRGAPAVDHARRIRRVRRGDQAVARVSGGPEEARRRATSAWSWSIPGRPASTAPSGREDKGKRLSRALCWVRSEPRDNGYARPLDGVVAVVDLNTDGGACGSKTTASCRCRPRPATGPASYLPESADAISSPLEIVQPEGPSFTVDGHEVAWQKWQFRIGFTPARGARAARRQLSRRRPRAAHPVPGLDLRDGRALRRPGRAVLPQERLRHRRVRHRHAGQLAGAGLRLPGHHPLLRRPHDSTAAGGRSRSRTPSACTRRTPASSGSTPTGGPTSRKSRRSRRLSVSFVATVGNYEYGFFWYFYQDGTIQCEVKLTGIMNTTALHPGEKPALRRRGRPAAQRAVPPAHLRRPARHERRRRDELGLRGQHGLAAARPGQPARQRLPGRGDAAGDREGRRSGGQRGDGALLADRQPGEEEPAGPAGRLPADARRELPAVRAARRRRDAPRRLRGAPPVGDAVSTRRSATRPATIRTSTPTGDGLPRWTAADRPVETPTWSCGTSSRTSTCRGRKTGR